MASEQDSEHLKLLSIFHCVLGVIYGIFSLFPCIHLVLGLAIVSGAFKSPNKEAPPEFMGWFFIIFALLAIGLGLTLSICMAIAGLKISRRQSHLFCLIVAGIECLLMPFGTVLGVFTIIVLMRPSVKQQFAVPL